MCSEMNAVPNINITLLQNIRGNYNFKFSFKTVTINWEKILQFIM